jgi:DNA uptake protein ComE-like DNA-binding protein
VQSIREKLPRKHVESFIFNPNTVSVEDLCRLGFTYKQAMAIDNYRKKGGRFRRKEDFARSFVVSDSVYKRLQHYVEIPLVDLNLADSAAFDALPGIGGWFASRMLEYRNQLGGYSYKEQLMDIWKFDKEKYDALSDLIVVSPEHVRPYPLWHLPADSLRLHPYIGDYAAKGIVLYRDNNPRSLWSVDSLASAGVLRAEDAARLRRCAIAIPE